MKLNRLSIRTRPPGNPVMHQTWDKLLFIHWPIAEALLRPFLPSRLHIDTFDGTAWISVTPFTLPRIRPALLPSLPVIGTSHEINVRTYVHCEGVPGVCFLSLDANNLLAVLGARLGFALPYFYARMALEEQDRTIRFTSRRRHPWAPSAAFEAMWRNEEALPVAQPESLEFFLIERYCLYATRGGRLYRTRIFHRPWPLCRVTLLSCSTTMVESHGVPTPEGEPRLHGQAAPLDVGIWLPEKI